MAWFGNGGVKVMFRDPSILDLGIVQLSPKYLSLKKVEKRPATGICQTGEMWQSKTRPQFGGIRLKPV